jgi:hypothetical protein
MARKDVDSYNALVGRTQEADRFYMKDGGRLESDKAGIFTFYGSDFEARELQLFLISEHTITNHPMVGSVLSLSVTAVMSPAYGRHIFSAPTDMSLASCLLPVASFGARLYLDGYALVGDANISISTDASVILLNPQSVRLSAMELSAVGKINLVCPVDGTWQIVDDSTYTQQANA